MEETLLCCEVVTAPIPSLEILNQTRSMMAAQRFLRLLTKRSKLRLCTLRTITLQVLTACPELFKAGGNELVWCMHQLICKTLLEKSIPYDWDIRVLCAFLKEVDPSMFANYTIVLTGVLCGRLKPLVKSSIGPTSAASALASPPMTISSHYVKSWKNHEKQVDTRIFLSAIRQLSIAT